MSTPAQPLIDRVAQALISPLGHDVIVGRIATFISQAMECFIAQFPYNNGIFAVLEDMRSGRVHMIGMPFKTSKSKVVTTYMHDRFDPNTTDRFDPNRDVATMVCFDRMCSSTDAKIGVMAYNEAAFMWLAYRYNLSGLQQTCHKMHRLAASRNRLTLTWPGLLNLAGESPPNKCVTCATVVSRNEAHLCGGCRSTTYCSRECQKADWSHHREKCAVSTWLARRRTNVRFAEFYEKFKSNFEDNLFVEGMSMVQFTVMKPKRSLRSLPPDARDIVMARNKRMQIKTKADNKSSCREVDKGDDVCDGADVLVRCDVVDAWLQTKL
jgi:hypothetical protein